EWHGEKGECRFSFCCRSRLLFHALSRSPIEPNFPTLAGNTPLEHSPAGAVAGRKKPLTGSRHMHRLRWLLAGVLLLGLGSGSGAGTKAGWITLFNGKDTGGWKLRQEKITVTKFLDASGKEIPGAKKKGKLIVDKKGNEIEGAKAVQETIINPSGWVAENDE